MILVIPPFRPSRPTPGPLSAACAPPHFHCPLPCPQTPPFPYHSPSPFPPFALPRDPRLPCGPFSNPGPLTPTPGPLIVSYSILHSISLFHILRFSCSLPRVCPFFHFLIFFVPLFAFVRPSVSVACVGSVSEKWDPRHRDLGLPLRGNCGQFVNFDFFNMYLVSPTPALQTDPFTSPFPISGFQGQFSSAFAYGFSFCLSVLCFPPISWECWLSPRRS